MEVRTTLRMWVLTEQCKSSLLGAHAYIKRVIRLLAVSSHLSGTKPSCWTARDPLGQANQKAQIIVSLALQHDSFVTQEWLAAKGLFHIIYFHNIQCKE